MMIGDRIRQIREQKKLSQGDLERKTGLFRCYISRVENGHTVPSVETLEKFAQALEVPLYQLFYESEEPPALPDFSPGDSREGAWGTSRKEARLLAQFRRLFSRMQEDDLGLLFFMAQKMQRRKLPSK